MLICKRGYHPQPEELSTLTRLGKGGGPLMGEGEKEGLPSPALLAPHFLRFQSYRDSLVCRFE